MLLYSNALHSEVSLLYIHKFLPLLFEISYVKLQSRSFIPYLVLTAREKFFFLASAHVEFRAFSLVSFALALPSSLLTLACIPNNSNLRQKPL